MYHVKAFVNTKYLKLDHIYHCHIGTQMGNTQPSDPRQFKQGLVLKVSFNLVNFDMSEIPQNIVQSKCRLTQLFLDTLAVILRKRAKLSEKFFLQLWKCNFVDFIEISGNRCANLIQTFTDKD